MWLFPQAVAAQQDKSQTDVNAAYYTAQSVVSIDASRLQNSPETDINKSLYAKIAGLNVSQGSGKPSDNYAYLTLNGHAPLILVDGFARDLSSVTMSEIESVSVLSDATALALYGVRGANGVVNFITRRGTQSGPQVTVGYQFGLSTQFRSPEFADSHQYAMQLNSALRLDGLDPKYSDKEIAAFRSGKYPYAYPNVNWWDEVYKKTGTNHQLNLTFTGGNERFRYFTAATYSYDRAMFGHTNEDSRYDANPFDVRLNLRTNVDVNLTKTTLMQVGLMGRMQEINGVNETESIYASVYGTPSAAFPIYTPSGIFGGNNIYGNMNPVARLGSSGHLKTIYTTLYADIKLKQDLSGILPGMYADVALSFDTQGSLWENSSKTYRYSDLQPRILPDGTVVTEPVVYGKDSEVLGHNDDFKKLYLRTDLQLRLGYDKTFGKHTVTAAAMYDQQGDVNNGRNNSFKRQSIMATVGYSFDNRYFISGALNYSGTAVLPENDRFNLYPSVSAAWVVSNEKFMSSDVINLLKIRASHGVSGWDGNIDHELFRTGYGYISDYTFGDKGATGWGETGLPVENLTVEKSRRTTAGIDVALLNNRLRFSAGGFFERRSNLLVDASNSISGVIGIGVAQLNAGINEYRGVDLSVNWNENLGDFKYGVSGILSFVRTKIVESKEAFQRYDYLYQKGNRVGQMYGLEAIGLFEDQIDINNSPVHSFSRVSPGDVKYKDQNGDNTIDDQDVVKMFHTGSPEIYYGFSLNLAYKNISLDADLQGAANRTVNLLSSPLYSPLFGNKTISETFLDREVTWSPEHKSDATMPRLTTLANKNNYRNSSLWYRNGAFLKLRHLQLAYRIPKRTIKLAEMSVYLRGTNLFSIDKIEFADPEQLWADYPTVRSYWVGIKFKF